MIREIKNGKLYFDGCDTTALAEEYGTPLYVFSESDIESRFAELKKDFTEKYGNCRVAYASKAFCSRGMYKLLEKSGFSIDVVSGGELAVAMSVDFPAERIEFNGNNKLPSEIDMAVDYGVKRFILDGTGELPLIEEACKKHGKKVKVMVRITPGVAASTHDYIITGKLDSKFGIPMEDDVLYPLIKNVIDSPYTDFQGLHMHIGSQLFTTKEYMESLEVMLTTATEIKRRLGEDVKELNLGGGFGVTYTDEERKPYSFFLDPMMERIIGWSEDMGMERPKVSIEPGRSIIAEAGITLYTVGQIKEIRDVRKYVSIDGGMGDNIRVPLYDAVYTGIIANRAEEPCIDKVTVCGKCCESGDIIIRDLMIPESTKAGDIVAVYSTGAYGYTMASNYNNCPIPAAVLVKDGRHALLIKRQTYEQIFENQLVPEWL
ncbi:MAG: diaminopimelate decarboxylase [Lachnospiraceae bacterium]|nr:diaminopimelate decarboxylase [Lachnospiraceae bacterium]